MNVKPIVFLMAMVAALSLLLGASTVQAEPVVTVDGNTAISIQNLEVGGKFYNVVFLFISSDELYLNPPTFDFPDAASAREAKLAVNNALNIDNQATRVGPSADQGVPDYGIGFSRAQDPEGNDVIWIHNGTYIPGIIQAWVDSATDIRQPDRKAMYADFTETAAPSEPVTIGGSVRGLEGDKLILTLNYDQFLNIDENGEFTFKEPLTPGERYAVFVVDEPNNPDQVCFVQNGFGTVPEENVTDVVVACIEASDLVPIGGTVSGLQGSGLILQNNGGDDLLITKDGTFQFETLQVPSTFYNVTVANQPSNPVQNCTVANGSGQVPAEPVTDIAVTCAEPVLSNIRKVAAEGDTLPDQTVLQDILRDGGVGINFERQVAFGGRDGEGTDAIFTQAGKVVEEGERLPDGSILSSFTSQGELAIGVTGRSDDNLAFHGKFGGRPAVFTQAGRVAVEGDDISDSVELNEIDTAGKVAINNFDLVAFHGQGRITEEGPDFGTRFRAVFTADGETTRLVAREDASLPDGGTLVTITERGAVAISDLDEVAFHGEVSYLGAPERGGSAVLTSFDGVVAAEGQTPDVESINYNGGVAINLLGFVAFHGTTMVPLSGGDGDGGQRTVKAVFTQEGVVAKEGDTLPDGTLLEEINNMGGAAINLLGDVVFQGRTGGMKAVFTQYGLVAKVGDNLSDGNTLEEIWDSAGVAIDPYGSQEVAFHGVANGTNAVLVGKAPEPAAAAE